MIVPEKTTCDICEEPISFSDKLFTSWGRQKIRYLITYEDTWQQHRMALDICPKCYKKMCEWIKAERKTT